MKTNESASKSRTILLLLVTILVSAVCWVLLSIQSTEVAMPVEGLSDWVYTDQGWIDKSMIQAEYVVVGKSPMELFHPAFWGALQFLACMAVLALFSEDEANLKSKPVYRQKYLPGFE